MHLIMSPISRNLQAIHDAITTAARGAGRDPAEISLLAVSKTFGPDAVREAVEAGQYAFGENYVQEALDKMAALQSVPHLQWHFIGPIQSNKTRQIAQHFDWVHSVERLKIAQRLSDQRPEHLPALNICLQINISGEASKSGASLEEAYDLAQGIAAMPRLKLRGLMAIPEPEEEFERQRLPFRRLRALFEELRSAGVELDTLSMGMSADMAAAILEGSTLVRVGTAIFGRRDYAKK